MIQAAHPFGLAPLTGFSSDVGIVGYMLGGGFSWLTRQYGFAAASIRSAELVTANGRLLHVDERNHSDLFWGLRGGGGNFGIVTSLEFSLYPAKEVFGGQIIYPIEQVKKVMSAYLEWVKTVPDELTSAFRIMHFPPTPDLPPMLRGKSVAIIMACSNGRAAKGEALLRPMRALGTPLLDTVALLPYSQIAEVASGPEEAPPLLPYSLERLLPSEY